MIDQLIKIVLIEGENERLRDLLLQNSQFSVISIHDIGELMGIPEPVNAVPEFLTVISVDDVDKRQTVIGALTLRNKGHQVFLSSARDGADLISLLTDVFHEFSKVDDKKSPFRTEILVTDVTARILGDISLIVKDFENRLPRH